MANDIISYPSNNIPIKKKNYEWILSYTKAAWADANGLPIGCWNRRDSGNYDLLKSYGLGQPPINQNKKTRTATDIQDTSDINIDWKYVSLLPRFREIIISKLLQREYTPECYMVDALSKSEEDEKFNEMKMKLMMYQQLQQMQSPLANSPVVKPQEGEPQSMSELNMQMNFGYKHIYAMDTEMGIDLIMQQNNIYEKRKRTITELVDCGIAGYKEWIDENGMVKFRECVGKNIVSSYCTKNDFSDAVHIGEVMPVMIADLVPYFTADQINTICKSSLSRYGNPSSYIPYGQNGSNWSRFKVFVFDLEFISYNTTVYEDQTDENGNVNRRKTDYSNIKYVDDNTATEPDGTTITLPNIQPKDKGQQGASFLSSTKKVVYRSKWIIGTDMMYDWGLAQNMNRKPSSWWDTSLSYHLYAWNFYEMRYHGMIERLVPIADAYYKTWIKLQDMKASLIPYLISIDLDALENVALGKGGAKMTPRELTDFLFQHGVLAYRSSGGVAGNPNYKPATIEASGQLMAFTQLYQDLSNSVNMMYEISGLNEATASSPDPKMLTTGLNLANMSTNNALYLIMQADKSLYFALADAIICKIQIAVKLGKVSGYVRAFGVDTVKFLEINPDISTREIGLVLQDGMTTEEKQELYQEINAKETQGLLTVADRFMIMTMRNTKQKWIYLNYQVEKNRATLQQQQQQSIQAQGQQNSQLAMQTEMLKRQTLQMQQQGELQLANTNGLWQWYIAMAKVSGSKDEAGIVAQGKIISTSITAEAKKATSAVINPQPLQIPPPALPTPPPQQMMPPMQQPQQGQIPPQQEQLPS